jgi:hypothetical protein
MNGGKIIINPAQQGPNFAGAGNTCLYGATGGKLYIRAAVGERFGVRNSGATTVVEGTGENSLTLDEDLAGLDRAYNKRLANLAGYIVCQQTNDGSKFFQTTNMKKNTAEQKEYIDTAVSMMEKAQKRFLEMREEPKYTAGIAKSVIWDIMSSDKNFMETTQRLFAKTIYHNT